MKIRCQERRLFFFSERVQATVSKIRECKVFTWSIGVTGRYIWMYITSGHGDILLSGYVQ